MVETGGFSVFNDREAGVFATAGGKSGVDPADGPGRGGLCDPQSPEGAFAARQILQAYVPDVYGKERRKRKGGKEGQAGRGGDAPRRAAGSPAPLRPHGREEGGSGGPPCGLPKADLLEKGLIGPDSAARRQALCRKLKSAGAHDPQRPFAGAEHAADGGVGRRCKGGQLRRNGRKLSCFQAGGL